MQKQWQEEEDKNSAEKPRKSYRKYKKKDGEKYQL